MCTTLQLMALIWWVTVVHKHLKTVVYYCTVIVFIIGYIMLHSHCVNNLSIPNKVHVFDENDVKRAT